MPKPISVTTAGRASGMLDLIGLLYDAAAAPERWRNFLEAGAAYFGAFGANFIRYDPDLPERSLGFLTGYGNDPAERQAGTIQRFVTLRHCDPRLGYSFDHPNKPFHCRQVVSSETLHASQSYQEVLRPNGVEYSLLVTFRESPDGFTGLAFMRGASDNVFDQNDVDDMGRLVPHLRRALSIQDRLATMDQRIQASYRVLDALPTGIVILRSSGQVEYANTAALAIAGASDGLGVAEGWLRLARGRDQQIILEALRRVIVTGEHQALCIERPSGRLPLRGLLSLLPLSVGGGLPNLLAEQRIVLYISDPERALETPVELLQRMFGLTRAEARLVERLVAGCSLTDSAGQTGIQLSTARSQLKTVFRKTETDSQAGLVRAVLSSPVWIGGNIRGN
jgi:DNA-binding CsgD family transcriptional regulator